MAAATKRVLLLNGPNLNLLGEREPAVYGTATLADHVAAATQVAGEVGLVVDSLQSNSSSELVNAIHSARKTHDAIVINPGAFTHYAWSIHDALAAFSGPVIEVHISIQVAANRGAMKALLLQLHQAPSLGSVELAMCLPFKQ